MIDSKRYFFVGPVRTGTTFIYEYLLTRPEVCLPAGTKEVFFFDRFYSKGLPWYEKHFECADRRVVVDVSPSYFANFRAIMRLRASFPQARIVITHRDPLERLLSHYTLLRRYGKTSVPIEQSIFEISDLVENSLYARWLRIWRSVFSESQVQVLDFETLVHDPKELLKSVCSILDLDETGLEDWRSDKINENTSPAIPWVARLSDRTSQIFRRNGLYRIIEALKHSPVHKLVYGSAVAEKPSAENVPEYVANMITRDYDEFITEIA